MLKKFSEAIGHITCFATFLIVSITLSGLIFFDSFTKGLKYNISILDIDFYSLLVQFLMALLHKDLKCKAPLIEPNLRRNLGKWST